ncbi:hypothetical protein ACJRO7_035412 [Eucalyptus globulus]|uniref:AAA+ ATPase domain-containing protein n=1 Tax=Eucalyptus globulus TaxID=34317 RepID=A0ABD3J669_EUCGL
MFPGEMFTHFGSVIWGLLVMWAMFQQYITPQLQQKVERYAYKLVRLVNPYVQIVFPEFSGEKLKSSEACTAIQNYLMENATVGAKLLRADSVKDNSQSLILSTDDHEKVIDMFKGVKVWWSSNKTTPKNMHRQLITQSYVKHILTEGNAIAIKNRQRKLYTNNLSDNWYGYKRIKWSHVVFEHSATFGTLAMGPNKKLEIYYTKIGKAWKRGYLLYGPPGTGKSTMIAAMANYLNYDVYNLELTAVKDNPELKKLLIKTSSKSIIVAEDIDCSLDPAGQRNKKEEDDEDDDNENNNPVKRIEKEEKKGSKVTPSGLLNFIDGIWSACGGERINHISYHVDKLDPALIRRGRMAKHIEMLNYVDIEDHLLFTTISRLLDETKMTPADVLENLMPKSNNEDVETGLRSLIEVLKAAKELEGESRGRRASKSGTSDKEVKENGVINGGLAAKEVKQDGSPV